MGEGNDIDTEGIIGEHGFGIIMQRQRREILRFVCEDDGLSSLYPDRLNGARMKKVFKDDLHIIVESPTTEEVKAAIKEMKSGTGRSDIRNVEGRSNTHLGLYLFVTPSNALRLL